MFYISLWPQIWFILTSSFKIDWQLWLYIVFGKGTFAKFQRVLVSTPHSTVAMGAEILACVTPAPKWLRFPECFAVTMEMTAH